MATAPLPPALEDRLVALAARVRRVRILDGLRRFGLAALLGIVGLVVADRAFEFSAGLRTILQLLMLGSFAAAAWQWVVRAVVEEATLAELAGYLERSEPALADRLRTLAGLRVGFGPAQGPPHLIATLARELELLVCRLDLGRAVPFGPAHAKLLGTGLAFLSAISLAAVTPGSGEVLRRITVPWYRPAQAAGFRIHTPSGDVVVRRDGAVTLTAYLEASVSGGKLPDASTIAIRENGAERRQPMTGDGAGAFYLTLPSVAAEFEYRVEVGPVAGEWHTVAVGEPVELKAPTQIAIHLPPYIGEVRLIEERPGFADCKALQYSTVSFRLHFTRSAASAALEWRPESRPNADPEPISLELTPDRTAGVARFLLKESGTFRLVLTGETGSRKLRTESTIALRATVDTPPRFEAIAGLSNRPRQMKPGESRDIRFVINDDFGLETAVVEAVVGTKTIRLPVALVRKAGNRVEGSAAFLDMSSNEGELVRFRVLVRDRRSVPEANLGPQETTYPPSGWAEVRVTAAAPPQDRRDVFDPHEDVREALAHTKTALAAIRTDLTDFARQSADTAPLAVDHVLRLRALRERTFTLASPLRTAADETALTPEIRPLTAPIRELAENWLAEAVAALGQAETDRAIERQAALRLAGERLDALDLRMEELLKRNHRMAWARFDRLRLIPMAAKQSELSRATDAQLAAALHTQSELLALLTRYMAESDSLKQGVEVAAGTEARRIEKELLALAERVELLDAAIQQLHDASRREVLDRLAAEQHGLAALAADFFGRTATAYRLARVPPPDAAGLRAAAEFLRRGQVVEALIDLEKAAQMLDRTAADIEKAATDRVDAKSTARLLAAWQEDLRTRFGAATKEAAFDTWLPEVRLAFHAEQIALHASAERLDLPAEAEVVALRDASLVHLKLAVVRLSGDGAGVDRAMRLAVETLARLADKTPTTSARLTKTRPELDKLRVELDSILAATEPILKAQAVNAAMPPLVATKLAAVQARQAKLVERFAGLDCPGLAHRRHRTEAALRAAAADLQAGLPFDSFASLAWAKRELDRLRLAADGLVPPDDKVDDLARQFTVASTSVPSVPLPAEYAKQLALLAAPEATALLQEARAALRPIETAKPEDYRQRIAAAAQALSRLADRLSLRESDLDRVKRLADARRRAAAYAVNAAGKKIDSEASAEARRQLGFELDELTHTRVGPTGQVGKRKVLDSYARLQQKNEPDRDAAGQKQLAEALDELAGVMTDVPELATSPLAGFRVFADDPAEGFLPALSLATSLRDLARAERAVRERAGSVAAQVAARTRPAEVNPFPNLIARQWAIVGEIETLAQAIAAEKDAATWAGQAAEAARLAAVRLEVGSARTGAVAGDTAIERLRQLLDFAEQRPWRPAVVALVSRQEMLIADIAALRDDTPAAAAQQRAQQAPLVKAAATLTSSLELKAQIVPSDHEARKVFTAAADRSRRAEAELASAVRAVSPADAGRLRTEATKSLRSALESLAAIEKPREVTPETSATGAALADAMGAMRLALAAPGDRVAVERAMSEAATALDRAVNQLEKAAVK